MPIGNLRMNGRTTTGRVSRLTAQRTRCTHILREDLEVPNRTRAEFPMNCSDELVSAFLHNDD